MILGVALLWPVAGALVAQQEEFPIEDEVTGDAPEETIPQPYPVDRYLGVWLKSPFQLEAAGEVLATPQSFTRDYSLTGIIQDGGQAIVYIQNDKTGEVIRLTEDEATEGFELISATPSPDPNDASVEVKRGNETATLKYAASTFGKSAAPAAGSPRQTAPPSGGALARPAPGLPMAGGAGPASQNPDGSAAGAEVNPAQLRLQQMREMQLKQQGEAGGGENGGSPRTPSSRRRVILPSQGD